MIFQLLPATRWLPPSSPYCTWLQKNIPLILPRNDLTQVQSIVGHFPRIALCLHKTVNLTFNCSKIAHLSWHQKISKRNISKQYILKDTMIVAIVKTTNLYLKKFYHKNIIKTFLQVNDLLFSKSAI